ncbi:MAG: ABC transporter ATP-binding protein [Steroidobacteraceae bacterium]|nr:ABC transporter ATP-binding protein [Steroidobacteraceae bacterium]
MASPAPAAVTAAAASLAARALEVAVPGRTLVRGLAFEAQGGDFVAVLGNNGVGKTLTLHTLAGLRAPAAGSVELDGRDIAGWPGRERARRLALLPQVTDDPFPATVFDTALIGRHPHLPFWQWEGAEDHASARAALDAVGLAAFAPRAVDTLSGGERRRLDVATLLAQDAAVCLLDEPTNHLDPQHRHEVLALFRARADAGGLVIATLHDATLAARWASHALLLFGDGRWQFGRAAEVLTADALSTLYAVPVEEIAWRGGRVFVSP